MTSREEEEKLQEFSKRLNWALDRIGWPEAQHGRGARLKELFGLRSDKSVSKWLGGRGMPKLSRIDTLGELCRVNPNWLLTGRGDPDSSMARQFYGRSTAASSRPSRRLPMTSRNVLLRPWNPGPPRTGRSQPTKSDLSRDKGTRQGQDKDKDKDKDKDGG